MTTILELVKKIKEQTEELEQLVNGADSEAVDQVEQERNVDHYQDEQI